MAVLGIDLGTSSVKMVLADMQGKVQKNAQREYSAKQPKPGWKEIDPTIWMQAVKDCLLEEFSVEQRREINIIAVTGQMHTLVTLDTEGNPLRDALMWNDRRAQEQAARLREKIEKECSVETGIGSVLSPGSPAAALLWMKEQEPELYCKIGGVLIAPDYIVYQLTGQMVSDYCDMSTSALIDFTTGQYSQKMLEALELSEEVLPQIFGVREKMLPVRPEMARTLGLDSACVVYPATGDNAASALGLGLFEKDGPAISIGTSAVIVACRDKPDFTRKGKNILFSLDGNDRHCLVQGSLASGGSALNWWIRDVLGQDFDEVLAAADPDRLETGDLIFCPYLNGDKYMYSEGKVQGAFFGLTSRTDSLQMAVAVVEGVAFGLRNLALGLGIDFRQDSPVKVTGGGSRSPVWMQMLANVLEVPVVAANSSSAVAGLIQSVLQIENTGYCQDTVHNDSARQVFLPKSVPGLQDKFHRFQALMDMTVSLNRG